MTGNKRLNEQFHNSDRKTNLHAPWRIEYINMLNEENEGCFLCRARDEAGRDAENLLLWRAKNCIVVMNRFPYSAGHLLIAPAGHIGDMTDLDDDTLAEMMQLARDSQKLLAHSIRADGFNIGINSGRCAGAGLPGHLHMHVVPRWNGDTNFMAVLGDVRIVSQSLTELYQQLRKASAELNLPGAG